MILDKKGIEIGDFSFSDYKLERIEGLDNFSYAIPHKRFSNVVLAAYNVNGFIEKPFLITTSNEMVEYFDLNNGLALVVKHSNKNAHTFKSYTFKKEITNKDFYLKREEQQASCGDDTMECIQDVYSNHGWLSVWATVQTAFIPQTAVAIAGGCAIRNCGGGGRRPGVRPGVIPGHRQ